MKKSILSFVGGAIFGLMTLSLSSCGNGDNALEQIVNSDPVVAFTLQKVLETNSVFVVKFKLNNENCSVTIKNTGDGFVIQSCEGVDPDLFKFGLTGDKKLLVLTKLVEAEGDDAEFQMFFNPQDNSFYIIDGLREVGVDPTEFDGKVSVNGIEGTLTDECPDKATIQLWYTIYYNLECRAGTRNAGGFGNSAGSLIVRYKNGETWQNVIDRYNASLFSGLVSLFEEPEGPEYPIIQVYSKKFDENYNDPNGESSDGLFTLKYDNTNYVSPSQKIGLKDDEAFTSDYPAIGLLTIRYE